MLACLAQVGKCSWLLQIPVVMLRLSVRSRQDTGALSVFGCDLDIAFMDNPNQPAAEG